MRGVVLRAERRLRRRCARHTTDLKDQYVDKLDDTTLVDGALRGLFEYGVEGSAQRLHDARRLPAGARLALRRVQRHRRRDVGQEPHQPQRPDLVHDDLRHLRAGGRRAARRLAGGGGGAPARRHRARHRRRRASTAPRSRTDVGKVRGEAGTKVTLSLKRGDRDLRPGDHPREDHDPRGRRARCSTARSATSPSTASARPAPDQFHTALKGLLDQGAVSIIFDLRDNPGGYIDAADKIASEFIGSGLIFSQESSGGEKKRWESTGQGIATDPRPAARRPRQQGERLGLGDRHRRPEGHAPRDDHRPADLRQEHGPGLDAAHQQRRGADHRSRAGSPRTTTRVAPNGIQPDITVAIPSGTPADQDLVLQRAIQELTGPAGVRQTSLRAAA